MTWIAFGVGVVVGVCVGAIVVGLCIASRDDIEDRDARQGRF